MRHRSPAATRFDRRSSQRRLCAGIAAALTAAGCLGSGCAARRAPDVLADRCLYVLAYREPELSRIRVVDTTRSDLHAALTLHFEARAHAADEPVSGLIHCAFEPDAGWALERAVIGDRELSEMELTLINAELLLFDLSEYPQRLERHASAATPLTPAS